VENESVVYCTSKRGSWSFEEKKKKRHTESKWLTTETKRQSSDSEFQRGVRPGSVLGGRCI